MLSPNQALPSQLWGEWCVEPSQLCPDPPMQQVPSINVGGVPGSPSQPIANCSCRNAKPLFAPLRCSLSPGSEHSQGWTDRQMGVWGGWQRTCGGVDTPEIKEQHGRVREVEGHLEGKGSVRNRLGVMGQMNPPSQRAEPSCGCLVGFHKMVQFFFP